MPVIVGGELHAEGAHTCRVLHILYLCEHGSQVILRHDLDPLAVHEQIDIAHRHLVAAVHDSLTSRRGPVASRVGCDLIVYERVLTIGYVQAL